MAFTAGTYWEVQTGGSDTANGGGFDTGVAGFPTDGAATSATGTAPVFSSASYNFVAGDVGAWIFIKSGTNWTPGWYKISSVAANAATLSAASGAGVLFNGFGATTTAGCATTASPTGATWGIDYSQQASPQISYTDLVIAVTTTNFTSASNPVAKNLVGNVISITSGVNFTVQRVTVVSTSGTTATCDKSLGTAAAINGVGGLGGCLLSPAIAASVAVVGNFVFIKSGTYSITTNSTNVAGGALSPANAVLWFIGYNTNRYFGNTDTQPVIQTSGSTISTLQAPAVFVNITFDGNSQTSCKCSSFGAHTFIYCTVKNYNTAGTAAGQAIGCLITVNSAQVFGQMDRYSYCEIYANTATQCSSSSSTNFNFCLAYNNTGASTDGFLCTPSGFVSQCIAVANGRDGFRGGGNTVVYTNCHSEGNTGWGYNNATRGMVRINCSAYNNTSGATTDNTTGPTLNQLSPTGSVFVSTANNNFALNNLPSQGALLRQKGYFGYLNGTTPRGTTVALPDIGACQSRVPWTTSHLAGGING